MYCVSYSLQKCHEDKTPSWVPFYPWRRFGEVAQVIQPVPCKVQIVKLIQCGLLFWLQWSRSVLSTQGASARRVPAEGLEEGQSLRTGSSAVRTDSWPGPPPRTLSNESRTPRARCQALSDTDELGNSKAIACCGDWEGLTRLSVAHVRHPGAPCRGFHGKRAKFWGLRSFASGHQSHHNHIDLKAIVT